MPFRPFQPFRPLQPFRTVLGMNKLAALISSLFGADEQGGLWLPGPDTCFTDTAATTAAGVGDTVARINDLSGRGNHATQATAAARPALGRTVEGGRRNLLLSTDTLATQSVTVKAVSHVLSFTGTGTVTLSGASTAGPLVGTGAGNRVSLTFTPTAASLTLTVTGSVTLAQLETAATATTYQKVGATALDVTEAGKKELWYLSFDGVDDSLVTPTIAPGVDKVQVFAGVRRTTDATRGWIVEHTIDANAQPGGFWLVSPRGDNVANVEFLNKGTAVAVVNSARSPAPFEAVFSGLGDISGDRATLRVNGVQAGQSTADQGSGNYATSPLFIGSRNQASLRYTGDIFGLATRFGANLATAQIESTEAFLAARSGVPL